VQLGAASPARIHGVIGGPKDTGSYFAEVVVDHVCHSGGAFTVDPSHMPNDVDDQSSLFLDLPRTGILGRLAGLATAARNGPAAKRRRLAAADQKQPPLVVEHDAARAGLPMRLHSDSLVSARRICDGLLMRYEKPTTCGQIGIGVGSMLKQVLSVGAVIFLLFFIVTAPQSAAAIAHTLWNAVVFVFNGLASFFESL
jgi:hypothetical protein